jgi:hypothetical protein
VTRTGFAQSGGGSLAGHCGGARRRSAATPARFRVRLHFDFSPGFHRHIFVRVKPNRDKLANLEPVAPTTLTLPSVRLVDLRSQSTPKDWPHAPVHRPADSAVYFVTVGTLHKSPPFNSPEKRDPKPAIQHRYLARLNCVHQNAIKRKRVAVVNPHPCCSAGCFERTASPAQVKTLRRFKTDRVPVEDDF